MNEIKIDIPKPELAAGERIEGSVLVQLDQDTPLRGIRLTFKGYEKASWREGGGKHRHTHSQTNVFFDEEVTLYGKPRLGLGELIADSFSGVFSKENYELLRAGSYQYPFSYVLPTRLPGDYESAFTNSCIYYGLKAQMDLPLKFDLKAELPLTIYEPIASTQPQPITLRNSKEFLLDSDSVIEVAVHLDRDKFQVGETLECKLEVMNRAPRKEIRAVTLALRQVETLLAQGRTHQSQAEINSVSFPDCRFPLKDRTVVPLGYSIPEDLYPTICCAELVKLNYELLIRLDIPWAVDAKLAVPLTLSR
jgi:hypothetical protein